MKEEIDKIYLEIQTHLKYSSESSAPEIRTYFQKPGMNSFSIAVEKREVLRRWSKNESLKKDIREYAKAKIEDLPNF